MWKTPSFGVSGFLVKILFNFYTHLLNCYIYALLLHVTVADIEDLSDVLFECLPGTEG
jgi:hypothetical protein